MTLTQKQLEFLASSLGKKPLSKEELKVWVSEIKPSEETPLLNRWSKYDDSDPLKNLRDYINSVESSEYEREEVKDD